MAYYSTPYNYNFGYSQPIMPMYPQQQLIEQTQMLPTQMSGTLQNYNVQNGQTNSIDSYMVWVQGKAGAQSYPVARGTTLPLFDSEGDFVYIKSVDNNGASYGRNRFGRTMGMYGRGSYGRSMTGGYSRDESKNTMINHLQEVADMAMDEKDRKAVMRLIEQMEMR